MRDELKSLEALSTLDAQLQMVELQLQQLPNKLNSLKGDVALVEALLVKERAKAAEAREYRAALEAGLKSDQDQQGKSKAKLGQVRNSKEYLAVQREFDVNRKSLGDREQELVKLTEAIENFEKSIAKHEEELAALHAHIAEETEETAKKIKELEKDAALKQKERDLAAAHIGREAMGKYESIRRRKNGLAVVPVRHGICTGCNMSIRPQLLNIMHRGETIECCPSCYRIIYLEVETTNGSV